MLLTLRLCQDQTMQHRMLGGGYTNMDSEYDQGYGMEPGSMMMANMPDQVANFLRDFQDWIHRDVYVQNNQGGYEPDAQLRQEKLNEIQTCYEYKFSKFSEVFYNNQAWPHADLVSQLVDGDDVFLMLYKELYFRHLYAKLGQNITIEQRIESWENYTSLFDRIFSDDDDDNNLDRLDLPVQWLWDMVDEFVYQFTDFCRFRSKDLKKRSVAEIEIMAQKPKIWDSMQVMSTLNRMVAASEIIAILKEDKQNPEEAKLHTQLTSEIGIAHVQLVLGYYALVSMCRMHCSSGDYYTALKCIENLDFSTASDRVPFYMRVTSCYIALYYYMGFSLMMSRRYTDAVRAMTGVLMYLYRTQHLTRPYQYEQLNKRSEQMYKLIAMCINLCPQRNVEDIVLQHLQDKYSDQLGRLAKGEEAMFDEIFNYAAPKFFYPGHPNYADAANPVTGKDISQTLGQQWAVFKVDMQQQQKLPLIRSYLKLYTTISTTKLASFAEGMPEERLRAHILALKHKSTGLVKSATAGSSPLDGEVVSSSLVDFYLDKGVVLIADSRQQPTFVHYFTKHISKLEGLVNDIKVRA